MSILQFFVPYLSLLIMFHRLTQVVTPDGAKFIKTIGWFLLGVAGINFLAAAIASMLRHYAEYGWI